MDCSTSNSSLLAKKALRLKRACVVCGAEAERAKPDKKSAVRMFTVTPQLYLYGDGARVVKMCKGVSICEICFTHVAIEDGRGRARLTLGSAITERLIASYNAIQMGSAKRSEQ
ncbi:MAG TPA: hypothetical protein VMU24_02380 [Candidatus Acidoferrales bacterium]|nr:hypothetical protein [Candidatus Acidoferrales bacterium]